MKIEEIRSEGCAQVARDSAQRAFSAFGNPLFVEDAGLFISALDMFPGAFSAWVFGKLGNAGILRLMKGEKDRRARFISAVAYCDAKGVRVFSGECEGRIAERAAGRAGFGYDPIFVPAGGRGKSAKTFAEDAKNKARVSHRRKALEKFGRWYLSYIEENGRRIKKQVV